MPEKRNLFGSLARPAAQGTVPTTAHTVPAVVEAPFVECDAGCPTPARFVLTSRKGCYWSYPYAYVTLIECPSPEEVRIHCNCGAVESIVIRGRGLDAIANALTGQRLLAVSESDRTEFALSKIVATEIVINRAD